MKTIRRLFFISIILLVGITSVSAQSHYRRRIYGDFFGGITAAQMDIKGGNEYKTNKIGFMVGGNVNYKFYHNIQFQSGLYLIKKGSLQHDKTREQHQAGHYERRNIKTIIDANYAQVPLNIGFEVPLASDLFVNFNVGVYGAYGFKGKRKVEGYKVNEDVGIEVRVDVGEKDTFESDGFKRWDYGVGGSVGLVYDIYILRLQYDHGLANIATDIKGGEWKTRNYALTFGFRF